MDDEREKISVKKNEENLEWVEAPFLLQNTLEWDESSANIEAAYQTIWTGDLV